MLRKVSDKIAYCYQRASECRAKAAEVRNDAARQELLELEGRWLLLARSYELSDRAADFAKELECRLRGGTPAPIVPRVACPRCEKEMRLASIEPAEPLGEETFSFICECGFTRHERVAKDGLSYVVRREGSGWYWEVRKQGEVSERGSVTNPVAARIAALRAASDGVAEETKPLSARSPQRP